MSNSFEGNQELVCISPILISPNWEFQFHVHIDGSQLVVGAMFAQNPTGKFDQSVMYTSKLLNSIERNYTTTEREALAMVYALQKIKHYLLGNQFVFYVDHMAFVYLVSRPQVFSKLARWLLLFFQYDFKIVYKLGRSHLMASALSRLPNQVEAVGVLDQTIDAHMFTLQPQWLQSVHDYMLKGIMPKILTTSQRQYLARKLNHLCYKMEYFIDLDKIIGFDVSCN